MENDAQYWVEEATLDYTMGDHAAALAKLDKAIAIDESLASAWHARAEILLSERKLEEAREAGMKAAELNPDDIHIHTSLSRIWLEFGDKEQAEFHGARARTLSWKDELSNPPPGDH